MGNRRTTFWLVVLIMICSSAGLAQYNCTPSANPPKLPAVRASGRIATSGAQLRVLQLAEIADSWKPMRREVGSVQAGTMVEVLEDVIVVDAPDIVRVTESMAGLKVKEGDTILRYAHLGEGWADLWAEGCLYKEADGGFITEPDGGGCGGSSCSARVTKMGRQAWWFKIKLPSGKVGWTLSQSLDLSAGG
jgi:hypothetical protein